MPHIMLDYSANMEDRVDMSGLCDRLRHVAAQSGVFPVAGIRVRALRADHVAIADGDPAHGYIDISVRLRGGRDMATKRAAAAALFEAARSYVGSAMMQAPVALSLELREIDPELSPKTGSIRDHIKGPT